MTCRTSAFLPSRGFLPSIWAAWVAGFALVVSLSGSVPAQWRWSNPTPHGGNIFDLQYGLGLAVEVTERGQIFTSEDFTQWQSRESHTTNSLRAIAFFGNRLVITGERGTVLWADSLEVFHYIDLGTPDWLEGLAVAPDLIVAVGDSGAIYTSSNGTNWQRRTTSINDWLTGVAYAGGTFVTVGENGLIATSQNGTAWTKRSSGTARHLKRVSWVEDRFWVVGDGGLTLSSPAGGAAWSIISSGATGTLFSASGNVDTRVVVGDSEVRLREPAGSWRNQLTNLHAPPRWSYYNALWDGSGYFIAGRSGMMVEGFQTNATAPYLWMSQTQPIRNWLWEVQRMPDFYVAVGYSGTVMTSEEGIDWFLELVPKSTTNTVFLGVGGSTNMLLAVGDKGAVAVSPHTPSTLVSTNADGTTLTNLGSTLGVFWYDISRPTTNDLQGVTVWGDQFVITGDQGTVLTSPDATNWVRRATSTSGFLSGVASHRGMLVAVGQGGTIITSADGTNWISRASGTTNWIYRVRSFGENLIAVGQNGVIFNSPDATNWNSVSSGTTRWLNDVTSLGDTYFAVGTQGTVLVSSNAMSWQNAGTITEKSLYGVASHKGQVLAVGVEGAIVRRQVIPDLTPIQCLRFARVENQNVFLLAGQPGQRFTLDYSSDLSHWQTGSVFEFLDSTGTLLLIDSPSTNAVAAEFYRARLVP